jgi:DNA-binding CsgD family transcriptional regulator
MAYKTENLNPLSGVFLTFDMKSDIYSYVPIITGKDYHDILDLVYQANRCEDIESLVSAICPYMIQMFRSECVTFQLVKGDPQHVKIVESRSFKEDNLIPVEEKYYTSLYKDQYYQHSPLLKEALSSPERVLKIGDSISSRDWERSDFFNYFIAPQHLYWEMFIPLRWKNNLEGMITLWRPRNQADYENCDLVKSEIIAPHLVLAIHNIGKILKINNETGQLLINGDANNEGLILLDHKMRLVFSNVRAREICLYLFNRMSSGTFNIETGEFPVPSCITRDCCSLLNLLKTENRPMLLPRERIIFIKNGRKFHIECSLIWKTGRVITAPHFVVTLSDLTGEKRLEANLQSRFHLTQREADIVICTMADMSYSEIAETLFISKLTVHSHIKNIYRKLRVKNRIELFMCVQSSSWLI